jgi:putative transposase
MANKRPKPEEIVSKLRQVEVLMGQGMPRLDAIRQIGVVEQTCYRWRKHGALLRHWSERQWRRVEWALIS